MVFYHTLSMGEGSVKTSDLVIEGDEEDVFQSLDLYTQQKNM